MFHPKRSKRCKIGNGRLWLQSLQQQRLALDLSPVVSTLNSCSVSPGKRTTDEALLTSKSRSEVKLGGIFEVREISSADEFQGQSEVCIRSGNDHNQTQQECVDSSFFFITAVFESELIQQYL